MRARTATILGSLALHALLGGAALFYARDQRARKPHSIAIASDRKKKEETPKPPKAPPPPPKPKLASAPVPAIPAAPAPPPEAPARRSAPAAAGTMSNVGGGEGSPGGHGEGGGGGAGTGGGGTGGGAGNSGGGKRPAAAAEPVGEAPCTEEPIKAQPVSRPTEIEYTQQARADGIEGRLVLKVIVDADGSVREVIVVSSVDPALDAAAIAAVKTWVFRPATRCGKPMAGGTYVLAQRFELGD